MKTSTTYLLLLLTAGLGVWLLMRGNSGSGDLGGHLLFDFSGRLEQKQEAGVDINPADVAGIDLKLSSGEFALRKQPEGVWEVGGAVKDRADEEIVKELLSYCTKAQIKDVLDAGEVKEGKTSAASLGLDDASVWRVAWLKADGKKLAEVKIGKTAPLDNVSYVQVTGQEKRPDIYIVSPDLRPLLARPPESFRDPRLSRYPAEVLAKVVVRKGEGEVEFSRTFQQAKTDPAKPPLKTDSASGRPVIEMESTPWVISRPLPNAPAKQEAVNDFVSMICGAKASAWLPYSETENPADKPVVEVTLIPAGAGARGVTLSFYKDPSDPEPLPSTNPGAPEKSGAPEKMALCRDPQRKASFKVPRQLVEDLCIAESPTNFRSLILASVDPAVISTIRIEQSEGVSVEVVRVRDRWYWHPLKGGKFEEAAPEEVEKLITLLNTTEIIDFASDSLSDPAAFGLDKPVLSLTLAAGAHVSLDQLTPVDSRNSQTLRIGLTAVNGGQAVVPDTQEKVRAGRFYANFTRDPFVFHIGPELLSSIPKSFFKWRSLTLQPFSVQQVTRLMQSIGKDPPLELSHDSHVFTWMAKQGGKDVTTSLIPGEAEALAVKAGSLQAVKWLDDAPGAARAALQSPEVRIDVDFDVFDDNGHKHTESFFVELAPMGVPSAPYCFGRVSTVPEPFLIQRQALKDLSAPLVRR